MTEPDRHPDPARTTLSFGGFQLRSDPAALYLEGKLIRLQAQPLRLLELLASRRGELVTHREIRQHLWRGHVVDFSAGIQVCMTQIRKALADDAASPRFIETVARHGYRFFACVQVDECQPENPPHGAELPAVGAYSVAGKEPQASTTSSDSTPPATRAANPWRFLPGIPMAILLLATCAIIAIVISADLGGSRERPAESGNSTANGLAGDLYRKAHHLSTYEQKDRSILALSLLQRALRLDPEHGPSHALIADLYARYGQVYLGVGQKDDPQEGERHLALAERLGADQSDVLVTRGRVALYRDRQVSVAQDLLERAIGMDAENPWAWRLLSQTHYLQGDFEAALAANEQAAKLSTDPNAVLWDRLFIYYLAERYSEMFALHDSLKHLQQTGAITVGVARIMTGQHAEAFDFIVGAFRSRGVVIADESQAMQLVREGRLADAYTWLLSEIEMNEAPPIGDRALAILEIMSGDPERAASRMRRYVREFRQKTTGTGEDCLCVLTLTLDPFFRRYGADRAMLAAIEGTGVREIEAASRSGASIHPMS